MEQLATINFIDRESGERAYASVRADLGVIALGLSLLSNGDVDVALGPDEARQLSAALARGAAIASASSGPGRA